jgi:hypothetical protein
LIALLFFLFRVRETRFQIVPKFHYAVRKVYNKEKKLLNQSSEQSSKLLEHLQKALDTETEQNNAEFRRLLVSCAVKLIDEWARLICVHAAHT